MVAEVWSGIFALLSLLFWMLSMLKIPLSDESVTAVVTVGIAEVGLNRDLNLDNEGLVHHFTFE